MARQKKKRIDVSSEREELSDNPFATLAANVSDLPEAPLNQNAKAKAEIISLYQVARTRKGNWPVRIEKRGGGKIVTIVEQISGDGKAFLKALQKSLGTGGKFDGSTVQIQGDHVAKVEAFLESVTEK
ncbi:MAG: hypothetical protein VCD00_04850 [Candidatus Hydrogenedentota bacterium]